MLRANRQEHYRLEEFNVTEFGVSSTFPPFNLQREFARRVSGSGEAEGDATRVAGRDGRALRLAPAPCV